MNGWRRWIVYLATFAAGITGVVYAVMRFLLKPKDPWSVVNHPWQPAVQHLHVLTAPLLVFAVGLIWETHVVQKWRNGRGGKRWSGIALAALFSLMAASGYLLQVSVDEGWRSFWSTSHLYVSLLWLGLFAGHWLAARLGRQADPASETLVCLEAPGGGVRGGAGGQGRGSGHSLSV